MDSKKQGGTTPNGGFDDSGTAGCNACHPYTLSTLADLCRKGFARACSATSASLVAASSVPLREEQKTSTGLGGGAGAETTQAHLKT